MTAAQVSLTFGASGYTGVAHSLIAKSVVSKKYVLTDVKTVAHAVVGTTTTYSITLKNSTQRIVRTTTGMTSAQIVAVFAASGYAGSAQALIAISGTPATGGYTITDVAAVSKKTLLSTSPVRFTITYTVTLKNAKKHTFVHDLTKTQESFESAVRATGYTGQITSLTNLAVEAAQSSSPKGEGTHGSGGAIRFAD
jgi:hypothetical protein